MKASHFVAIASLVLASPALATTLIVPGPGTGNAQGPTPFNYYGSSGSRVQQIYYSSFFPAPSSSTASVSEPIRARRLAFSSETASTFPTSSFSFQRRPQGPMKAGRSRARHLQTISEAMRKLSSPTGCTLPPPPPEQARSHLTTLSAFRSPSGTIQQMAISCSM